MRLFPYKRITYSSDLMSENIVKNLQEVINSSKKKNYFNSTTSDYIYDGVVDNDSFRIRRRSYSNKPFNRPVILGKIDMVGGHTEINIIIKAPLPQVMLFLLFLLVPPFFFTFSSNLTTSGVLCALAYILIGYLLAIFGFNYDAGQIDDFFKFKILRKSL